MWDAQGIYCAKSVIYLSNDESCVTVGDRDPAGISIMASLMMGSSSLLEGALWAIPNLQYLGPHDDDIKTTHLTEMHQIPLSDKQRHVASKSCAH